MKPVRIAILGATSYIAKGLIAGWNNRGDRDLFLYARSPERVKAFLSSIGDGNSQLFSLEEFGRELVDVVVNCVGIGDPGRLKKQITTIFEITAFWDNRVLEYLSVNRNSLYLNLSSGAVYGSEFAQPVQKASMSVFPVNALRQEEFYGIAKLHAEARHRSESSLNIVDLRVFSYFSRFVDLTTHFLMTDIIMALKNGRELVTTPINIVRDYIHPDDLLALMDLVIMHKSLNGAYDVYSLKPVTKFEMLESFATDFGLRFRLVDSVSPVTATGTKDQYYSINHHAANLGYEPRYCSLEALRDQVVSMLKSS